MGWMHTYNLLRGACAWIHLQTSVVYIRLILYILLLYCFLLMYNTEATGSNTVSTTTTATATGGTIATATAIHTGKLGLFDLLHSLW